MLYPALNEYAVIRNSTEVFGGYNHNPRIADGEFYDMENLTSSHHPLVAPRSGRGIYTDGLIGGVSGVLSKNGLYYVKDDVLYKDGNAIDQITLCTGEEYSRRQLVSIGSYIVVFPDNMYINTTDYADNGVLENSWSVPIAPEGEKQTDVRIHACYEDGTNIGNYSKGITPPPNPADGETWIDSSTTPCILKTYSEATGMWCPISKIFIEIDYMDGVGMEEGFKKGDGIIISGIPSDSPASIYNGNHVIYEVGKFNGPTGEEGAHIIIPALDEWFFSEHTTTLSVKRQLPKMDFVIEHGNRLWGCRYGESNNGEFVNEIYCSKLGDFKNWMCYTGISTDSWTASVGSDGAFTGAITYGDYRIFFKENCMHIVYGTFPSNFTIQTVNCRGVEAGSSKSLAIVNEVLYWKAKRGIMAYDGSLPVDISTPFGNEVYTNGVAGSFYNKYYIEMTDSSGNKVIFVYDTAKGMWHKENECSVVDFCFHNGELLAFVSTNSIMRLTGGNEVVKWYAETGTFGFSMPEKKYISKLNIRLSLDLGSLVNVSIQYDSKGNWINVASVQGTKDSHKAFPVYIKPCRCDHFRLRIDGRGEAKIYSITKTISQGSDKI